MEKASDIGIRRGQKEHPLASVNNEVRKILKEMGIPDHLTCILRNLCMLVAQS